MLLAAVAGWLWRTYSSRPSAAVVGDFLRSRLAPLPVHVAAVELTFGEVSTIGHRLQYRALLETTAPLYRRLDAFEYFRTHPFLVTAGDNAAGASLGTANGRPSPATLPAPTAGGSLNPQPARPNQRPIAGSPGWNVTSDSKPLSTFNRAAGPGGAILLATQTPAGATAEIAGNLIAWRQAGGWRFATEQDGLDRSPFAGEPKPAGTTVFVVDDPADIARLKTLLADASGSTAIHSAGISWTIPADANGATVPSAASVTAVPASNPVDAPSVNSLPNAARSPDRSRDDATAATAPVRTPPPATLPSSPTNDSIPSKTTNTPPSADVPTAASAPVTGSGPSTLNAYPATEAPTPLVPFPTDSGAYVRVGNHWQPLPRNNGHVTQTADQALAMLRSWDAQPADAAADVVAELIVDGRDPVPVVPAADLVLVYVGPRKQPSPEDLALHPILRTAPAVELAPLKPQNRGIRRAPLYSIAPGYVGFGPNRVAAVLEEPRADVIVLRCAPTGAERADATRPKLTPGRYALLCGPETYEVEIGG